MDAYEFLEQVKDADSKIDAKKAEERELWAIATSMTQANDGIVDRMMFGTAENNAAVKAEDEEVVNNGTK